MRRAAALVLLTSLSALAACGSGQSPVVEGAATAGSSTTVAGAPVDPAAVAAGDPNATTVPGATDGGAGTSTGTGAAAGGGTDSGTGGGTPSDPGQAAFGPPAPGTYTFQTSGTRPRQGALGQNQQESFSETSTTVVTLLAADTVRQSSSSSDGDQVLDLRYEPNRVALLAMQLTAQGQQIRFASAEGVQFTPVPPAAGQTWSWDLTDDTGDLHLHFEGTSQPSETISIVGAAVDAAVIDATLTITGTYSGIPVDATVQIRTWVDPARRTAVKLHQVSTFRQPFASTSDTTSELTGFTPA